MKKLLVVLPLALLAACAPKNNSMITVKADAPVEGMPVVGLMPKATAFRMTGDYADKVAVTFGADGRLVYYPAPSDISAASRPLDLGNGWWLNRQGLSANSVFTKWTFDEYAALKKTPSQEEIKAAVIPGARVSEMRQLPYTISEASSNLPAIREMLE